MYQVSVRHDCETSARRLTGIANGLIPMMILCLHDSHHVPSVEKHVSAHDSDPLCNHRYQVLSYRGMPAVPTLSLGAAQ
jgi:hypothetical protein